MPLAPKLTILLLALGILWPLEVEAKGEDPSTSFVCAEIGSDITGRVETGTTGFRGEKNTLPVGPSNCRGEDGMADIRVSREASDPEMLPALSLPFHRDNATDRPRSERIGLRNDCASIHGGPVLPSGAVMQWAPQGGDTCPYKPGTVYSRTDMRSFSRPVRIEALKASTWSGALSRSEHVGCLTEERNDHGCAFSAERSRFNGRALAVTATHRDIGESFGNRPQFLAINEHRVHSDIHPTSVQPGTKARSSSLIEGTGDRRARLSEWHDLCLADEMGRRAVPGQLRLVSLRAADREG